jgi:hypothetical protein
MRHVRVVQEPLYGVNEDHATQDFSTTRVHPSGERIAHESNSNVQATVLNCTVLPAQACSIQSRNRSTHLRWCVVQVAAS